MDAGVVPALAAVVAATGFTVRETTLAFLTKIVVAEKPS